MNKATLRKQAILEGHLSSANQQLGNHFRFIEQIEAGSVNASSLRELQGLLGRALEELRVRQGNEAQYHRGLMTRLDERHYPDEAIE